MITGFPGESEEDFEESYRFVDDISFFETHIFPYSLRKGTKAASMKGQLTEAVKKQRASRLIELNEKKHRMWIEKLIGSDVEVLIEELQVIDGREYWVGHTKKYEKVAVESDRDLRNTLITVQAEELIGDDCIYAHEADACM